MPNASFEAPDTEFADPAIHAWQKTPKPEWYDESGGNLWIQLTGVFQNPAEGEQAHKENIDGDQALFLFALPEAGLFQDYNSVDLFSQEPSHAFDAIFEPGFSYDLTVGITGGGGGMAEGASLQIALYYLDAEGDRVVVATNTVIHSTTVFPTNTQFVDFTASLPAVRASDPWAGRHIGILLLSTAGQENSGGYWDIDNVRLTATPEQPFLPNASFESPETDFADPRIDSWQKTPKPEWYDESGGNLWIQLTGVFKNPAVGEPSRKENIDGDQALFLFALPAAGIFQDYHSVDMTDSAPTYEFDTKFEVGRSYDLTVGITGGGGGMTNGASMQIALYYRDATSNQVIVASTTVVHDPEAFPVTTRFVDFTAHVPAVEPGDPWAGQNVGVLLLSTVTPEKIGGYWDIDNVRLVSSRSEPGFNLEFTRAEEGLRLSWPSQSGFSYQVRRSEDLQVWNDLDAPVAGTGGELSISVPASLPHAFFTVVANPSP